jgi:peroxiredoxin
MKKQFKAILILFIALPSFLFSQSALRKMTLQESPSTKPFLDWCAQHPYSLLIYFNDSIKKDPQADMIIKGIENYFTRGFAFHPSSPVKNIPTAIILRKKEFKGENLEDCKVFYDSGWSWTPQVRYRMHYYDRGNSANIVLVNNKLEEVYYRQSFKGIGEQLRPMEEAIRKIVGDTLEPAIENSQINRLNVGEIAPDFQIKNQLKLSDLIGKKNIIISFYPAPFTGSLQRFEIIPESKPINTKEKPKPRKMLYGGCGGQAIYLENLTFKSNNTIDTTVSDSNTLIVYISASSDPILYNWEKYLGTKNIIYTNDPQYYISKYYGSYNYNLKYNLRSLFIINKSGKITYANYNIGDNLPVKSELEKYLDK